MREISINDIEGFYSGHYTNQEAGTGCTVVLCPDGAKAGCDIRGGAPATRETDILKPENLVQEIHGVILAGGSAFGLDAASGVMSFLKDMGAGYDTGNVKVPLVSGASLYDLSVGMSDVYPDFSYGYEAGKAAFSDMPFENGNIGAGTGATVGKILGIKRAMKSGIGSYAIDIDGVKIGAVVAVNSFGDIFDEDGRQIAGFTDIEGKQLVSTEEYMYQNIHMNSNPFTGNTTIGCVITNAVLSKSQCTKIAQISHNGIARAIRPAHTSADGDSIFVMSKGNINADFDTIGSLASMVVKNAIIRGVKASDNAYGLMAYKGFCND